MAQFTTDNTEGFTAAELAALNAQYDAIIARRPGASEDERKGVAEQVLRRFDNGLTIGARVEAGDNAEDHDTGRIVAIDGDQFTVAWDSGVRTTQQADGLRAA